MYRIKAEYVKNSKVYAGGKWLTCIGNLPVKVGDNVWTDGCCIYGNVTEGNAPFIHTIQEESVISILTDDKTLIRFYSLKKHKLKVYPNINLQGKGEWIRALMLNNKHKANIFFSNAIDERQFNTELPKEFIEAEYSKNGKIYTIENFTESEFNGNIVTTGTGQIKLDNEIIKDISALLKSLRLEKKIGNTSINSNASSQVGITNARIDSEGNYNIIGIVSSAYTKYDQYGPDYVLQEKQATVLITTIQENKYNFKEFLYKVRQKNIRVILFSQKVE